MTKLSQNTRILAPNQLFVNVGQGNKTHDTDGARSLNPHESGVANG